MQLYKTNNLFLFISRNKNLFESVEIDFFRIKGFNELETKKCLEAYQIDIGKIAFNDLYSSSEGNPLYLFYYSEKQTNPLPTSIQNYQNTIWKSLTALQQELLIFISISFFSLELRELSQIKEYDSPLRLSKELENISNLVKTNNGVLEIFHSSFAEHIILFLENKGLLNDYKKKLGDFFLYQKKYIQAVCLLIDIAPQKIAKYLIDVFPALVDIGEIEFSIKILSTILTHSNNKQEQGYAHYHLCNLYRLTGERGRSKKHIELALNELQEGGSEEGNKFYNSALMSKAMNYVEDGFIEDGLRIVNDILVDTDSLTIDTKAIFFVNLSKVYIDLSEFGKGANVCKKAFNIFEKNGNREGMFSSLTNLVSCLIRLNGYLDDAEMYGLKLLNLIDEKTPFIKDIIVLNALTSIYRQKKEYPKAISYGEKVIKLCQKYKLQDRVVLNLTNLGNVLRDYKQLPEAIKIYDEALILAKNLNLKKEEGRIYWILSSIERDNGYLDKSIEYAERSIEINQKINYYYGVANAFSEKAESLISKGNKLEGAKALEKSAEFYSKIEYFKDSYHISTSEAIAIYKELGEADEANRLLNGLILDFSENIISEDTLELNLNLLDTEDTILAFDQILASYLKSPASSNITLFFLNYIDFCKGLELSQGKKSFIKSLDMMIDNIGKKEFSCCLLGIAIEQSGDLLDINDLTYINERLSDTLILYNYRKIQDVQVFISSIDEMINIEITTFDDELHCNKLAIMLVLFLHEKPTLVINDRDEKIEEFSSIFMYDYSSKVESMQAQFIGKSDEVFSEHMQSLHAEKRNYEKSDVIVVSEEFFKNSDFSKSSNNKATLYFLTMAVVQIKDHFYHTDIRNDFKKRGEIIKELATMYGYTSGFSDVNINVDSFM
ncbi:MAG: tetratricopeptide (TPR) repeat protein [Flammeovirgaceae bacterium]|jgi:tetratricopeptide (TPR) repeat protein